MSLRLIYFLVIVDIVTYVERCTIINISIYGLFAGKYARELATGMLSTGMNSGATLKS